MNEANPSTLSRLLTPKENPLNLVEDAINRSDFMQWYEREFIFPKLLMAPADRTPEDSLRRAFQDPAFQASYHAERGIALQVHLYHHGRTIRVFQEIERGYQRAITEMEAIIDNLRNTHQFRLKDLERSYNESIALYQSKLFELDKRLNATTAELQQARNENDALKKGAKSKRAFGGGK